MVSGDGIVWTGLAPASEEESGESGNPELATRMRLTGDSSELSERFRFWETDEVVVGEVDEVDDDGEADF